MMVVCGTYIISKSFFRTYNGSSKVPKKGPPQAVYVTIYQGPDPLDHLQDGRVEQHQACSEGFQAEV